jgi:hypothetical protein
MSRPALLLLLASFAVISACRSEPPPPASLGGGTPIDPNIVSVITGRVTFTGTPPPVETLRMTSDQECVKNAGPNPQGDAVLIAPDGSLQNVFVHVKEGVDPAYGFDVPTTPAVLDQRGCVYAPRVIGILVGQPLEIVNSDPTLHNVHALPKVNLEFNTGQPLQGMRERRIFTAPEVMVRFKCDVHQWMAAYVGVVAHPFFAVTGADGRFELKGLPPGTYTIEAWHERFGTRIERRTIGERETKLIGFSFSQD